MDVSKKTLHKIHSRRKFITKTNNRLQKSERTYNRYQTKKEHLAKEKNPLLLKRVYNRAAKPYELQYHITRTTDDKGSIVYKQGFRIAEKPGGSYHQRGVLHKIDSFRRNNIYSDVSGLKAIPHVVTHSRPARLVRSTARFAAHTHIGCAAVRGVNKVSDTKVGHAVSKTLRYGGNTAYKAASVTAERTFKTGLAAETSLLNVKDYVQRRSKAALELKVRQEAQGDGEKSGVLLASNTLAASKGLVKHLHDKHRYKPLQKNLNNRIKVSKKIAKSNKHLVRSQNKQFIRSAVISERFRRKTGREKTQNDNVQYTLTKRKKLMVIYCNVDTSGLSEGQTVKKGEVISHVNSRRQEIEYSESFYSMFYDEEINPIDCDYGYDYLNITCYNSFLSTPTDIPRIIDPEIILSLSSVNISSAKRNSLLQLIRE